MHQTIRFRFTLAVILAALICGGNVACGYFGHRQEKPIGWTSEKYEASRRQMASDVQKYEAEYARNPNDAALCFNLGVIYDEYYDNPAKAVFYYSRYIELAPEDAPDRAKVIGWIENCRKRMRNPDTR
ncbi:MAG: hypothetical protein V1701_02260 [Planctomycetota bacterium]